MNQNISVVKILIVFAIIGVVILVILTIVRPNYQFSLTNNSQRYSDVNAIINAVYQYATESGQLPLMIRETPTELCRQDASDCTGLVDLRSLAASHDYLQKLPIDPSCPANCPSNTSGYVIYKNNADRLVVTAPLAEMGQKIMVTR